MSIYNVINSLKEITPLTLENAQKFLDEITALEREQLIAAIYLGREHIHWAPLITRYFSSISLKIHFLPKKYVWSLASCPFATCFGRFRTQ